MTAPIVLMLVLILVMLVLLQALVLVPVLLLSASLFISMARVHKYTIRGMSLAHNGQVYFTPPPSPVVAKAPGNMEHPPCSQMVYTGNLS